MGGGQTSAGGLEVTVGKSREAVLKGVANARQLVLNLVTTGDEAPRTRPPLNLAVVLDRSGSMAGKKLDQAKAAAKMIATNLFKDDVLHFVAYDSTVEVVFEGESTAHLQALLAKIDRVNHAGCTNLYGGLEKGGELVNRHHKDGYAKRVFLLSDGLANEGKSSHADINGLAQKLFETGVKTDTFGIGDDFDEKLMKTIAECGRGAFYYIHSPDVIQQLVGSALSGLLQLFATDAVVQLGGLGDTVVTKVYGRSADLSAPLELGDLHLNGLRQLVCEVSVTPPPSRPDGPADVMSYTVSYLRADSESIKHNRRETVSGVVQLLYTTDASLVARSDPAVEANVAVQKTAESDAEVLRLLEAGDVAQAKQKQEETVSALQGVLASDTTGMVAISLKLAEQTLDKVRSSGASNETRQHVAHCGYAKRRGSMTYMGHYS